MTIHVLSIDGRKVPTRFYPDFGPSGAYCCAEGDGFKFYLGELHKPVETLKNDDETDCVPVGFIAQ